MSHLNGWLRYQGQYEILALHPDELYLDDRRPSCRQGTPARQAQNLVMITEDRVDAWVAYLRRRSTPSAAANPPDQPAFLIDAEDLALYLAEDGGGHDDYDDYLAGGWDVIWTTAAAIYLRIPAYARHK
jgi:hypothetical protein